MSSSGLIYMAILGAWVVYLASRCLRTPAHQPDSLVPADGAVLRRRGRPDPYAVLDEPEPVPVPIVKNRRADLGPRGGRPPAVVAAVAADLAAVPRPTAKVGRATARRRRRMLGLLALALVSVGVVAGLAIVPLWSVGVPALLLLTYVVELRAQARRAEARLALVVRPVALPAEAVVAEVRPARRTLRAGTVDDVFVDLWPTFDEPVAARVGDGGWQPVPVPLPTYVTAARAPDRPAFAGRRIDIAPGRPWVVSATEDTAEIFSVAAEPSVGPEGTEVPAVAVAEHAESAAPAPEETAEVEEIPQKKAVNS